MTLTTPHRPARPRPPHRRQTALRPGEHGTQYLGFLRTLKVPPGYHVQIAAWPEDSYAREHGPSWSDLRPPLPGRDESNHGVQYRVVLNDPTPSDVIRLLVRTNATCAAVGPVGQRCDLHPGHDPFLEPAQGTISHGYHGHHHDSRAAEDADPPCWNDTDEDAVASPWPPKAIGLLNRAAPPDVPHDEWAPMGTR